MNALVCGPLRLPFLALVTLTLLTACGEAGNPTGLAGGGDDATGGALANLQAEAIVPSDPHPFDDETVTMTGIITNSGDGDAGAFNWTITVDGIAIARGRVANLSAGETLGDSIIRAHAVGPFPAGDRELKLAVDVDDEVRESDESSNVKARRLVVQSPGYDIQLEFSDSFAESAKAHVVEAAERWEAIVTGDLEPTTMNLPAACGNPAIEGSIDDIRIFIRLGAVDGAGGTLARGGPCFSRGRDSPTPTLPLTGQVTIDESDVESLLSDGRVHPLLLHEIAHVMGIGTKWDDLDLIAGAGTRDPFFAGPKAASAFLLAGGGSVYSDKERVPVANTGGSGTRDSHWRESVLLTELMTGFAEPSGVAQELSAITVGSLMDLGYTVDFDSPEIDEYTVPAGGQLLSSAQRREKPAWDDVQTSPQYVVTREGEIRRIR